MWNSVDRREVEAWCVHTPLLKGAEQRGGHQVRLIGGHIPGPHTLDLDADAGSLDDANLQRVVNRERHAEGVKTGA